MQKHMKKDRKEKTKFPEILPNNQIITACCIELRVKEMAMNEKLTMIGLMLWVFCENVFLQICYANFPNKFL